MAHPGRAPARQAAAITTWTLTSHTPDKTQTIIGAAEDPEHAQRLLIAATQAAIERAAEHSRPRYTLHIDGQLTAIVQTGDDDLGLPDHAGAAQLLEQLSHTRNPFER